MTAPLPILRDFSDRLSPMVVKEMRQGLRTRFFTAALILFHLVLGLLMAGLLFSPKQRDIHEMFWLVIIATLLGILPLRGFNVLNSETKDGTLDLLVLTGISSFRIVWGKWVSLYSQTLLVACSLLPYMIARYQLGGVELVRELLGILILGLGSAIITAALVGFSSQHLLLIRLILAVATGFVGLGIGIYTYVLTTEHIGADLFDKLVPKDTAELVLLVLGVFAVVAFAVYELLCIGSARLPLVKDSQGSRKRLIALSMLVLICGSTWWMLWQSPRYNQPTMAFTLVLSVGLTLLVGMDVLSEESPSKTSPASSLVHRPGKLRWVSNLLQPGWPTGVPFYLLLCLLPMSAIAAIELRGPSGFRAPDPWCWVGCLLMANVVPLCIPIFRKDSRLAQWILVQLLMLTLGIVFIILMGTQPYDERTGLGYLGVITPISTLFGGVRSASTVGEEVLVLGSFVSTLWVLAASVLAVQERRKQSRMSTYLIPHDDRS